MPQTNNGSNSQPPDVLRPYTYHPTPVPQLPPPHAISHVHGYHHYLPPSIMPRVVHPPPARGLQYPYGASYGASYGPTSAYQIPSPHNIPSVVPQQPSAPPSAPPPTKTATAAGVKVKYEPGTTCTTVTTTQDTSEPPLNFQDRHVMDSLRQMGFQDETEIMQAVRSNAGSGPDDCMLWIINQREEQEEAKKMDAARARSEELRQEATVARIKGAKERYEKSDMEELSTKLFSSSIVLKHAPDGLLILKQTHANVLYKFLQLEQNLVKWYKEVPWCYLVDLAQRWKDTQPCAADLESTITELEQSIYSLEKQRGGIPVIFVDKQRDAERQGKPIGPTCRKASDDDDDVILVVDQPTKKFKTCASSIQNEVIEIA